jgi:hypothetical protein
MVEYRLPSFALRSHQALGDSWSAWHVSGEKIQRCLSNGDGFLLATETLDGDQADLVAFAIAGSGAPTHNAEAAGMLSWRQQRQTRLLRGG